MADASWWCTVANHKHGCSFINEYGNTHFSEHARCNYNTHGHYSVRLLLALMYANAHWLMVSYYGKQLWCVDSTTFSIPEYWRLLPWRFCSYLSLSSKFVFGTGVCECGLGEVEALQHTVVSRIYTPHFATLVLVESVGGLICVIWHSISPIRPRFRCHT